MGVPGLHLPPPPHPISLTIKIWKTKQKKTHITTFHALSHIFSLSKVNIAQKTKSSKALFSVKNTVFQRKACLDL